MSRIGELSEGNRFIHAHQIQERSERPSLKVRTVEAWHKVHDQVQHLGQALLHGEVQTAPVQAPEMAAPEIPAALLQEMFDRAA